MAGWKKIWENELIDKSIKNKELEEKYNCDYVYAIEQLGLNKANWQKLKQQFPKLQVIKTVEDMAPENLNLPPEIDYDSDCDGYDSCWINRWHIANGLLIFEQYFNSTNKYYGNYSPDATTTLKHYLVVFKKS